jgi:hypothetical protein
MLVAAGGSGAWPAAGSNVVRFGAELPGLTANAVNRFPASLGS